MTDSATSKPKDDSQLAIAESALKEAMVSGGLAVLESKIDAWKSEASGGTVIQQAQKLRDQMRTDGIEQASSEMVANVMGLTDAEVRELQMMSLFKENRPYAEQALRYMPTTMKPTKLLVFKENMAEWRECEKEANKPATCTLIKRGEVGSPPERRPSSPRSPRPQGRASRSPSPPPRAVDEAEAAPKTASAPPPEPTELKIDKDATAEAASPEPDVAPSSMTSEEQEERRQMALPRETVSAPKRSRRMGTAEASWVRGVERWMKTQNQARETASAPKTASAPPPEPTELKREIIDEDATAEAASPEPDVAPSSMTELATRYNAAKAKVEKLKEALDEAEQMLLTQRQKRVEESKDGETDNLQEMQRLEEEQARIVEDTRAKLAKMKKELKVRFDEVYNKRQRYINARFDMQKGASEEEINKKMEEMEKDPGERVPESGLPIERVDPEMAKVLTWQREVQRKRMLRETEKNNPVHAHVEKAITTLMKTILKKAKNDTAAVKDILSYIAKSEKSKHPEIDLILQDLYFAAGNDLKENINKLNKYDGSFTDYMLQYHLDLEGIYNKIFPVIVDKLKEITGTSFSHGADAYMNTGEKGNDKTKKVYEEIKDILSKGNLKRDGHGGREGLIRVLKLLKLSYSNGDKDLTIRQLAILHNWTRATFSKKLYELYRPKGYRNAMWLPVEDLNIMVTEALR